MRPSGVTGRRVFIQDSSRPATGFVPAYSNDRDAPKKPEKEFKDFFGSVFSEGKRGEIHLGNAEAAGSPL
jgi:hypothetical protein